MSWRQLSEIFRLNREERQQELSKRPLSCPNDGTALESGKNGQLHCPFDGWIWRGW